MNGSVAGSARLLVACSAIAGYALLAHWSSTATALPSLWLPLAVAPLLAGAAVKPQWRIGAVLIFLIVVAIACNSAWRNLFATHLAWLYFIQDNLLNAALGLLFGATLLPGRVPLCSQLALLIQNAKTVRSEPSARLMNYTRGVTLAWTIFFAAMIIISTCLFSYASRSAWSTFANLLYWPLLSIFFGGEYLLRLFVLPPTERAGLVATIDAFRRFASARTEAAPA